MPIGRIAGVFGIRGELKCDPSSAGRALFSPGERLRVVLAGGEGDQVELAGVREHKGRLLLRLRGVDSADAAARYIGAQFVAPRERIVLEPGEYLDRDLEGCTLYDEQGHALGQVGAVEHYPSSDMLVVDGKLVPMVAAFIRSVDTPNRRIVVTLPPGLLDDREAET